MSDSINEQRCESENCTGPHDVIHCLECCCSVAFRCPGPSVVTPPTFDAMLRDPNEQFSDPTLTDAVIRYAIEGEPPMTDPYTWETRLCDDQGMVSNEVASQLVGGHPTTYLDVYDNLVQHHIYRGSCPRVTEPFACTGSMHLGAGHIRCTSPAHAHVTPDELDGGFVAERLDIPGVISQGETREEALTNLADAVSKVVGVTPPAQDEPRRNMDPRLDTITCILPKNHGGDCLTEADDHTGHEREWDGSLWQYNCLTCSPDDGETVRWFKWEGLPAAPSVSTDHTDEKENAMSDWKMYLVDEPGFNGVVLASGDYPDEPDAVVHIAHAIAADGSDDRSALGARLVELLNAEASRG